MGPLSRRQFLARAAMLSAALGVGLDDLARALTAPAAEAALIPSTLQQTILFGRTAQGSYRQLTAGPGEAYVPRLDVLRKSPDAARTSRRRSLLYLGHLSDLHVIDAQSPGRVEPMIVQNHTAWGSAFHPHDPLSPHTTAAMVQAFSDARYSPLTGAPMAAAVVTGDSADMHSHLELRWYIDLMDGVAVDPASSGRHFQGVQAWDDATWAYRPSDPRGGAFGDYGFPRLPTLLADAIAAPVQSPGLPAPWYAVYGNHDTLLLGTFELSPSLHALAVGGQKSATFEATASSFAGGWGASNSAFQQAIDALGLAAGRSGFRSVTANPDRRMFETHEFMAEHFVTEPEPGPVCHGFTAHNLESGDTWWSADLSPHVRALGLIPATRWPGPMGRFLTSSSSGCERNWPGRRRSTAWSWC